MSVLIPEVDLAPSVTSRVVTVHAIDMQEGAPATGSVEFVLPADVHVPVDDVILQAGSATVTLEDGRASVRLPCYDPDTRPDGWVILVKKSWAPYPYAIRVPMGTTPISLVDIEPVAEADPGMIAWLLTGASVTVEQGAGLGGTVTVSGGIANFKLTFPEMSSAAAWSGTALGSTALGGVQTPGVYTQQFDASATEALGYPEAARGTLVVTALGGGRIDQQYTASTTGRVWVRQLAASTWGPWRPVSWQRNVIASGSLDDYMAPTWAGTYRVSSGSVAHLPAAVVGTLEVFPLGTTTIQRYTTWEPVPRIFVRTFQTSGVTNAWLEVATTDMLKATSTAVNSQGVTRMDRALGVLRARLTAHSIAPVPLVFAGSSTTSSVGASSPDAGYVNQIVAAYQDAHPSGGAESIVQNSPSATFTPITTPGVHGYNAGQGATTAATYLTDAESDAIAALNPAMIMHMIGSNDFSAHVSLASYRSTIEARLNYLDAAIASPHVHVLVHSFERMDVTTPTPSWKDYGAVLYAIGQSRPDTVAVIDISEAFRLVGVPSTDPLDLIGPDGVHAVDTGYRLITETLRAALAIKAPR